MFKEISTLEKRDFENLYNCDNNCLEILSQRKWKDGFKCRHCGNTNYCMGKAPLSRRCTRCKKEESVTANTIFHRCKIPMKDAFKMAYLICHNTDISTYELSRIMNLRQMTCWKFKKKITECLEKGGDAVGVKSQ
ncbi:transposase [Bacteroidota bacterium]